MKLYMPLFPVLIQNLQTCFGWLTERWLRLAEQSFTLTDKHVGKTISATLSDINGNSLLSPILIDGNVVNVNDLPEGGIFIEGQLKQGNTAKINIQSLNDEDGLGPLSFEWFSDGVLIENETSSSLYLNQDLAGRLISARVKYTDQHGTPEFVEATATSPVIDISYPVSGDVILSSTHPKQFELLSADVSDISDDDGIVEITNQWLLDGVPIKGETSLNYRVQESDLGGEISFAATVLDAEGVSSIVSSVAATILEGTPPLQFNLNLESKGVVGSAASADFVVQSSHASVLIDSSKIEINNGEIQKISAAEDGLSHTVSINLIDPKKPASLSIFDGAFADVSYGISNKDILDGNAYALSEFVLPENIYDVGERHGYSEQIGELRYDLYDKVSYGGSDYYYLSYSENSMLYRYFSEVDPEISNGTFNLSLPTKEALEELFTNSSLDGTNSGNSISNNDVWWHQDYWYRESGIWTI